MTRAVAIAQHLAPNRAACDETAAWIWGVVRSPGRLLAMTTLRGRVPVDHADPFVVLHEYRFEPGEIFPLETYAVTTKLRTAYDLLRSPEAFTQERHIACRLLLARTSSPVEELRARAARSSKADRGRVARRLREVYLGEPPS